MGKYTKDDAVRIITACARKYDRELSGRNLLFIALDKHKRVVILEVSFSPYHFKHAVILPAEYGYLKEICT